MLKCVFLTFIKQRQQQRALVYETPKTHSSNSIFQVLIQHEPLSHLDQVKQGWLHELPDTGQRLQEELGLQLQVQTLGRGKTGEKSDRTAETRSIMDEVQLFLCRFIICAVLLGSDLVFACFQLSCGSVSSRIAGLFIYSRCQSFVIICTGFVTSIFHHILICEDR